MLTVGIYKVVNEEIKFNNIIEFPDGTTMTEETTREHLTCLDGVYNTMYYYNQTQHIPMNQSIHLKLSELCYNIIYNHYTFGDQIEYIKNITK